MGDGGPVPEARDLERRWEAVRGRMEAASEILARRGSIASRRTGGGTRVYSIRYPEPGETRQRAVYLGAEGELVCRARDLLAVYRERERQTKEIEEAARFTAASGAFIRRLLATRHARSKRPGKP